MNFRPLQNFYGYEAGEDGNIYSYWGRGCNAHVDYNRSPLRLKSSLGTSGYLRVNVKRKDKFISIDVHRLVCIAWYGYREKLTVSHKNGNKKDNTPSNLCWETYSENLKRKLVHGTDDRGYKNSRAKINKEQYIKIKHLLEEGLLTHKAIGDKFGVSRVFITKIKCGHRYGMFQVDEGDF